MQVINDATTREINCPHCGSRLKVSRNDVGYVYSFAHHSYFYVECPVCEKRIELKDLGEWKKYLMRLVPDDD
jgi:DNA-directed RNA polymerase subunit RPC12/RpoP